MHQAVQYLNVARTDSSLLHVPGQTHHWRQKNRLQGLIMIILGAVPSQVQNLGNKVSDKKTAALTLTCNRYSSVYFFKHPNFEIIPWEHIGLSWAHYTPYSQASPSLLSSICPLASWNSQCWQVPWRQRDLIIPSSRPLLSPGLPHHLSRWRVASWWASSSSPCFPPLPIWTFLGQLDAWQLLFVHLET